MTDNKNIKDIAERFNRDVIQVMKKTFVAKDEVIDLLAVSLVAGENLFILGPPGTAKSALVQELARHLDGNSFDYLLTRFTEPNELFGPFDIRKLREGELVTNTMGMLPEAELVFLDELLNANSAILNSLLTVLNERVFRRGRENHELPTLMVVGASNNLPEDDALNALFDRFLLRVYCGPVADEELQNVLTAGWALDMHKVKEEAKMSFNEIRQLQTTLKSVDLSNVISHYAELIHRIRHAGIDISDRRAVKLQKLIAASALICGRTQATVSDLWVMQYIWDLEEQQEILRALVQDHLKREKVVLDHPRASINNRPDSESLARDLESIEQRMNAGSNVGDEIAYLKDRLSIVAGRCEWIEAEEQRQFLQNKVDSLRAQLNN